MLRGVLERYTDAIASDGSVADVRVAAATRLSRRIAIGAGLHVLRAPPAGRPSGGSTIDVLAGAAVCRSALRWLGLSGSVLIGVAQGLSIAGWARSDNRLRAKVADTVSAVTDLPRMAGGGILFAPSRTPGSRRPWPGAPGRGRARVRSTRGTWSAGMEVRPRRMPIRLGARGGQMPFGPGTTAPTEVAGSLGTGRGFAQGRALIDVGLERLERRGGGITERVWTVLVGLTVRP